MWNSIKLVFFIISSVPYIQLPIEHFQELLEHIQYPNAFEHIEITLLELEHHCSDSKVFSAFEVCIVVYSKRYRIINKSNSMPSNLSKTAATHNTSVISSA